MLGKALTERTTTSTVYTKLKEIKILQGGIVTVEWKNKRVGGGINNKSRVYINGAAIGSEHSSADEVYEAETETGVAVNAGDAIQIYAKSSSGAVIYVKDMYVKSAGFMTDIVID